MLILKGQVGPKNVSFFTLLFLDCHDVVVMSIGIHSIAISNIYAADYHCIIFGIIKHKAINVLRNADLSENSRSLWNIKIFNRSKNYYEQVFLKNDIH